MTKARNAAVAALVLTAAACGRSSDTQANSAMAMANAAPAQPAAQTVRPASSKPLIHVYKSPT